MTDSPVIHLTAENWQVEVMASKIPVLVDFWAEWCGPCRMIAPTLEELAGELAGRLKIGKVNVGEQPQLAEQFHVRSIPTLLLIKEGAVREQMVGALSKADLHRRLQSHLQPA